MAAVNPAASGLRLAWQAAGWLARGANGGLRPLADDECVAIESGAAKPLPAPDAAVEALWLPVEWLAPKVFRLPLAHPRFLDQAIVAQEWEDQTGEETESLWLAWDAARMGEGGGVAGLMAAMPEDWRAALDGLAPLAHVRMDARDRLDAARQESVPDGEDALAVLDADAEGVFFGVWRQGIWQGMSRLNDAAGLDAEAARSWVLRALNAMGWPEEGAVAGRLDAARAAWFADFRGERLEALPDRAAATLALTPASGGIEFRHGRWAARTMLAGMRRWRGAAILAALALALWAAGAAWENHRLHQRIAAAQDRVNAAFARALPGEPVIDALAQLRKAAGAGGEARRAAAWLAMMDALARVFAEQPWTVLELEWRGGEMRMRGEVADLQALNRLRQRLADALGREVRLDDTELGKDKVGFRMVWS